MKLYTKKVTCCANCPALDIYNNNNGFYCNYEEQEMDLANIRYIDERCPLQDLQEIDYETTG